MSMNHFDIVITNGTLVIGEETIHQDIGIRGSTIEQIGGSMSGDITLDASNKFVLPGGVDPHVHLSSPEDPTHATASWTDDFYVGSLAAIAGGVTTIGNMTFQWPTQSLRQAIERDSTQARNLAAIDYILHPVLTNPTQEDVDEIRKFKSMGIKSLKIFMVNDSFELQRSEFMAAIEIAAENDLVVLLHCEDPGIIKEAVNELEKQNLVSLAYWSESRPISAEVRAVENALQICKSTHASIYIVHLSSGPALLAAAIGKADGLPVFVETRPMYLHLTKEKLKMSDGASYIGAPPLRNQEDAEALWEGLRNGSIDVIGSDHAPFTLEDKLDPRMDIRTARQGVSDLETSLPILFFRGVIEGRITINRFVQITSTNPAKIFGISHKKGSLEIGKDADIAIWDPKAKKTMRAQDMASKSGYSVYEGVEIIGLPETIVSRGVLVMRDYEVTAIPGYGKWIQSQ